MTVYSSLELRLGFSDILQLTYRAFHQIDYISALAVALVEDVIFFSGDITSKGCGIIQLLTALFRGVNGARFALPYCVNFSMTNNF